MVNLKKGIIIKIDSDKSWILSDGGIYQADIKKSLLQKYKPVVGDKINFEIINLVEKTVLINSFKDRNNLLLKPKIANVDQVVIFNSIKEPNFNSYLLNKYLIFLNCLKIQPILVFTKNDLIDLDKDKDRELLEKVKVYKNLGYEILILSNKKPQKKDLEDLNKILENKISVFVGQTGVGKSSTLNRFLNNKTLIKTQEISQSLNRGKHTTTNTQIYCLDLGTLVADTPGFGNFNLSEYKIQDMIYDLPLLKPYLKKCKYNDCIHVLENTCSLKQPNSFPKEINFIYDDYCQIIGELRNKKGKLYEKNANHS